MLIEEGFQVVSVDASDKMLKYALKERWNRRKDPGFDDWSKTLIQLTQMQNYYVKIFMLNNCCFFLAIAIPSFCVGLTVNNSY